VRLFAVSVDPPETSEALRQRLESRFTFLSDPDGKLLDLLKIRQHDGKPGGGDVAYPTQVLVDENGIVRWTFESGNYRVRARPSEIFAALSELHPAESSGG
jgi:peroxiredoxin